MASTLASPSEQTVRELSGMLSEPDQRSRHRVASLELFNKLPVETSQLYTKYVDMVSGLNLGDIQPGLPTGQASIPAEIKHLLGDQSQQAIAIQVDSKTVQTQVPSNL